MLLSFVFILVGFVLLILGANWLVEGASSIARKLGISALTIGLTVVALGTSAPELVVNIISSSSGNTELALGNVIGSNIFNIFMILGIAALVKPVGVQSTSIKVEIPFNLLASLALIVVANDMFIDNESSSTISRIDGIILLLLFCIFMYYNFLTGKSSPDEIEPDIEKRKPWLSVLMVVAGLVFLVCGGKLIVSGAVNIATAFGVSQSIIGLTIVAAGTSLPELATSAIAAYKNKPDIAIGNVIGSNVFNVLFILGISSVITPIPVYANANVDLSVNIIAGLFMLIFAIAGPGRKIDRREGAILVSIFVGYTLYLIYNA
ncbi:MAG: calcium/sodium antiporter [Bacteroidales bacterium]